jgi:hypothetical protein
VVADQALLAHDNDGLTHCFVLIQDCFDLTELDSKSMYLDLLVDTSEILDVASRQTTHEIATPVQTRSALAAESVRDETLGRQLWPIQITARHPSAADVQLTRQHVGHGPQVPVKHVNALVRNRSTNPAATNVIKVRGG